MIVFMRSLILLSVVLVFMGCAAHRTSHREFNCENWPIYPKVGDSNITSAQLISLFRSHADPNHVELARLSAGDVENGLRRRPSLDIEIAFYRSQIQRLERVCSNDGSGRLAAAAFVEIQASALANAADLQNASDEVVRRVVPSELENLTAASNILILAAACSSRAHPRLASALAKKGLECFD